MSRRNIKKLIFSIVIPVIGGALIGVITSGSYEGIAKPPLSPPGWLFPVVWTILYILLAISIYLIYKDNKINETKSYNKILIINYVANQAFQFLFFTIKSPFLALIDTIIVFISSLYLYYESKKLNANSSELLIPDIIWNGFASILITSIFFMNL